MKDAAAYLREHGCVDRVPNIRARDWSLIGSPLRYLLKRRFGLVKALSFSDVLIGGSWFHKELECMPHMTVRQRTAVMHAKLSERLAEIREICSEMNADPSSWLEAEEREFHRARSWMAMAESTRVGDTGTLQELLEGKTILGHEVEIVVDGPLGDEGPGLAATLDILWWNEKTGKVWIFDGKTTSYSPLTRLSTCLAEFQTWHYLWVVHTALERNLLQQAFDLPSGTSLGGMIHGAFQKPTIRFCNEDRPFEWEKHTLKSGPRKGQKEMRKKYTSPDPSFTWFIKRCMRWYRGEGEYEHLFEQRQADPPVNYSTIPAEQMLATERLSQYHTAIKMITDLATVPAHPVNFPAACDHLLHRGEVDPYLPFHVCPVKDWPSIVEREGFLSLGVDEEQEQGVYPAIPIRAEGDDE